MFEAAVHLQSVDLAEDQVSEQFAVVMARVMVEEVVPDDQAGLAVALVAPVGERPVVGAAGVAEAQWVNSPVAVEQGERAERVVLVERVDDDEMAAVLEGRLLAAEREDVWDHEV